MSSEHPLAGVLTPEIARLRASLGRTTVVGLCGAQGSGKSTLALNLQRALADQGLRAAVLSLDDLYLPRAERRRLARAIHPLLITRGPPGTHDVPVGHRTLDDLASGGVTLMPGFSKASDEPLSAGEGGVFEGSADVVIFEGWCVGAAPQSNLALQAPINELEATEDPDGIWRSWINDRLRQDYLPLFARLDHLVLLKAPSFEIVAAWRIEQEAALRRRIGNQPGPALMDEAAIGRFVAHYERLTRHILQEMPDRADRVVVLDETRDVLGVSSGIAA